MWQKNELVQEFQKRGKRMTKQRSVIFDVILNKEWISCKEVYYEASKQDPTIGLSTVYRTLRAMEEIGILKKGYRYASHKEMEALDDDKISH